MLKNLVVRIVFHIFAVIKLSNKNYHNDISRLQRRIRGMV